MKSKAPSAIYRRRVEQAAVAIFAGMQANAEWEGSAEHQARAVKMARKLVDEVDAAMEEQR